MPQTLRGRVIRNDNIAVALPCGTENAVAVATPPPALPLENVQLGNTTCPYGVERTIGTQIAANPEVP